MRLGSFVAGAVFGVALGIVVPLAAQFPQIRPNVYGLESGVPQAFVCVDAQGVPFANRAPYFSPQAVVINGIPHTQLIVTCP